jgi:hypothetical protein
MLSVREVACPDLRMLRERYDSKSIKRKKALAEANAHDLTKTERLKEKNQYAEMSKFLDTGSVTCPTGNAL